MITPLTSGQQFILQAPQPQPRPQFPPPMVPMMPPPSIPFLPPAMPVSDSDSFSKQNDDTVDSKPANVPIDSDAEDKQGLTTDTEKALEAETDLTLPKEEKESELKSENSEPIVMEESTVEIDGPIILNLKSTTKSNLTIMAGQDLAELINATGPELLQKAAKTDREKEKKTSGTEEKASPEKPTINKPSESIASITEPLTPVSSPVVAALKMGGFNTLA